MFAKEILLHFKTNVQRIRFRKISVASKNVSEQSNVPAHRWKDFVPFDQIVQSRRLEANRSLIVQIKNESSYENLMTYSLNFGNVKNSFYYCIDNDDSRKNFVLIEYDDTSAVQAALLESQHSEFENVIPVTSPFLWLRMDKKSVRLRSDLPELRIEQNDLPSIEKLSKLLSSSHSFSDDMIILHDSTKLGEIGSRLRFISALQLEAAFKVLFTSCKVLPFGSSINSFGKLNCDLDLVFELNEKKSTDSSRFVFHSKTLNGMSKLHNQRHLEIIADVIQYCLPGCCNTRRILHARVPIIKYKHELTGIDCDVSSMNLSGVYMSELLYTFGAFDWRVRPLVFAVRFWAKEINLTNPTPGKWVTNFMLTLLVLFHLQYEKLLPSLQTLINNKRPEDNKAFVDCNGRKIDCGFLTNLNFLGDSDTYTNNDDLFILFFKFFEFYSTFDFRSNAISLNSGRIIPKPDYDAMYIVNPLEKGLNVSRNVSQEECDRLRVQCRHAAWSCECSMNSQADSDKKWGLLDLVRSHLLNNSVLPNTRGKKGASSFIVKNLFNDDYLEPTTSNKTENV